MKRLIIAAVLTLGFGGAAHADGQDIVVAVRKACRPAPGLPDGYGLVSAEAVRDAVHEQLPLPPGVWVEGVDAMADRAMKPLPAVSDDDRQLSRYRLIVAAWSEVPGTADDPTLRRAGVRIEPTGANVDVRARLVQLLRGDKELRIVCRGPTPEPAQQEPRKGPHFLLVKQASDLGAADFADGAALPESPIAKKSFAEFTYVDDRQTHVQSWAVKLAAGLQWPEQGWVAKDGASYLKWNRRLYVAYDRQGENNPLADGYVNNLDFGGQLSGRFGFGKTLTSYYAISAAYRTDDDFKSKAYAVELSVDPPLPYIPYHRGFRRFAANPIAADFKWGANLVADWIQVDDPGRRQLLADQAEYARLGYDAGFDLRFGPAKQSWRLLLSVDYGLRDGQTKEGGDAQLFTSSLVFLDKETTNQSFGLSYERGENLQSFENSELWKIVLGVRY
jgi:hypothetical protein